MPRARPRRLTLDLAEAAVSLGNEDLSCGGAPRAVAAYLEGRSARPFLPTVRPGVDGTAAGLTREYLGCGGAPRADAAHLEGRYARPSLPTVRPQVESALDEVCPSRRDGSRRRAHDETSLQLGRAAGGRSTPDGALRLPTPLPCSLKSRRGWRTRNSRLVLARPATLTTGNKFKNRPVLRGL